MQSSHLFVCGDLASGVHLLAGQLPLARNFPSLVRLWPRPRICVPSVFGELRWRCNGTTSTIREYIDSRSIPLHGGRRLLHSSSRVDCPRIRSISIPRSVIPFDWVTSCKMVPAVKMVTKAVTIDPHSLPFQLGLVYISITDVHFTVAIGRSLLLPVIFRALAWEFGVKRAARMFAPSLSASSFSDLFPRSCQFF